MKTHVATADATISEDAANGIRDLLEGILDKVVLEEKKEDDKADEEEEDEAASDEVFHSALTGSDDEEEGFDDYRSEYCADKNVGNFSKLYSFVSERNVVFWTGRGRRHPS